MNETTMLWLVGGGLVLLYLLKSGRLKLPGASPAPPAAAGPTVVIRHEQGTVSPAAAGDSVVHEAQIQIPMTIRVLPRGPLAPPPI